MLFEAFGDEGTITSQLCFQGLQYFNGRHGQRAFGGDDRFRAAKLFSLGKNLHPLFIPLWMKELVRVQEVLPFAFSGLDQALGVGNRSTNAQAERCVQSWNASKAAG
jgi:hypothetical protein